MQELDLTALEGTVQTVIFQNPENGYTVLKLRSGGETVTAVGILPGVTAGEGLRLYGAWGAHQSYGEQFKAEYAERYLPDNAEAIYEYLASGAIRGIRARTARLIVDRFGAQSLDIIENEPEELTKIKGITAKKAAEISERFRRQTGLRRLMEFLVEGGVRPIAAAKLFRIFGDEAEAELTRNPYILADEAFGTDFFEADAFARRLGFAPESPERIRAAVTFEMRHNENNGHVFLPRDKLARAASQLIEVPEESAARELTSLIEAGEVICERVAGVEACYLPDMYEAETEVASRLGRMTSVPPMDISGLDGIIGRAERSCGITFAEKQREALSLAARCFVLVLTGGPGTGKTTTVRGILDIFDAMGLETLLAAPTGRAAKRLTELTGREAQTVHRLLGAGMPEAGGREFERCASDPLKCDAVILDETSMMDIKLMAALLDAMPQRARLVMVGDADQLPSVGAGNVFADVIRSGAAPVVALRDIFRQSRESGIVRSAHMINEGEMPPLKNAGGDFFFMQRSDPARLTETVTELITKRLPANMGIPAREIQVLVPSRKGAAGTYELNLAIQAGLNPASPEKKEKTLGNITFRVGDRVMQTRNNYDILWYRSKDSEPLPSFADDEEGENRHEETGIGIFNGDIGYIEDIDERGEYANIRFEDKLTPYPFDQMTDLELAYAVTVHKSQGSEYRAVVLALPKCPSGLVTRSVLYTAVTRARELLVVAGESSVMAAMVANDRRQRRYSGLRARLAGEVG